MRNIYNEYLFNKHILVSDGNAQTEENQFETVFALARLFNIRITEGEKLAHRYMIHYVADRLGVNVPAPFYMGFPKTVRNLTKEQLLFDQLVHYTVTYGFGNFSEAGHSLFEENFERIAFKEDVDIKDFIILDEESAVERIGEFINDLLASSRPLSDEQYELVKTFVTEYKFVPEDIASKNTAVKLLIDLRNPVFANYISMSDVIRLVDELNYKNYENVNIRNTIINGKKVY